MADNTDIETTENSSVTEEPTTTVVAEETPDVVITEDDVALFDGMKPDDELTEPTDFEALDKKLAELNEVEQVETHKKEVEASPDDLPDDKVKETEDKSNDEKKEKLTFKANGKSYDFTEAEVLEKFGSVFAKAENYTKKTQELSKDRGTLKFLKDNDLSDVDLNLLVDVYKGNKGAIKEILRLNEIDTIDLEPEETDTAYKHTTIQTDSASQIALDDVISNIENDDDYLITKGILTTDWDETSRGILLNDPNSVAVLHKEVQNGNFTKINDLAQRNKIIDPDISGKTDMYYYIEAEKQIKAQETPVKAQPKARTKMTISNQALSDRKSAGSQSQTTSNSQDFDYINASEEAYEQWYESIK